MKSFSSRSQQGSSSPRSPRRSHSKPDSTPLTTTPPTRVESSSSFLIGETFSESDHFGLNDSAGVGLDNSTAVAVKAITSFDTNVTPSIPEQTNWICRVPPNPPVVNSFEQHNSQQPTRPNYLVYSPNSQGAMSALTDPFPEAIRNDNGKGSEEKHKLLQPRFVRNRDISGAMKLNRAIKLSQSMVQRVAADEDDQQQHPRNMPHLPPRHDTFRESFRVDDTLRKLSMAHILDPVETEAETAIMSALEKREKGISDNAEYLGSLILPNMTLDAVIKWQSFLDTNDAPSDDQQRKSCAATSSSVCPAATKPMDLKPKEDTVTAEQSSNTVPLRVARSERTMLGSNDGKPPPVPKDSNDSPNMDMTLSGLNAMLRNIHKEEVPSSPTRRNGRDVSMQESPKRSVETNAIPTLKTHYDSLANNAAMLLQAAGRTSDDCVTDPIQKSNTIPAVNQDHENDDECSKINDIENGGPSNVSGFGTNIIRNTRRAKIMLRRGVSVAKEDFGSMCDFFIARKMTHYVYIKLTLLYLILPATAISALLFYAFGNPLMKTAQHPSTNEFPSVSWFLLFFFVRQAITFSLARATEIIVIDFIALKTRFMINVLGPLLTLVVVQSKGWPFTITWWAIYDLCMLSGDNKFAHHWLYFQDNISLFNDTNPSGNVVSNTLNSQILCSALILGILVGLKRFFLGLYLGGRQYASYGTKLSVVMHKIIVISEVARLARQLESVGREGLLNRKVARVRNSALFSSFDDTTDGGAHDTEQAAFNRVLDASEKFRIAKMLESWEEPLDDYRFDAVSVGGILQFKQSLAFMDLSFPFSRAFGRAGSRQQCVQSAEEIFNCLVRDRPDSANTLHFETLSLLARDPISGELNERKLKDLVKVFRPERDGTLTFIEFIRSIDRVYKDFRLLRASIRNSGHIDQAFEVMISVLFYLILFCLMLLGWGVNPLEVFVSLSSVILAFTFAIGSASSQYFEGLMFIILRTPYDIGDRISIDGPNDPPGIDGVFTWFVEDVTLYFTTVRLGATNECATISNSSLSHSRIINAARSHKAVVYINLKFGLYVPYEKIQLFKESVETFVKARPREWLSCNAIRATRVESDLGYVAYVVVLQHRDSWQHIGVILESKAAVTSFCLEVQKQLGMKYVAPPSPVELSIKDSRQPASNTDNQDQFSGLDQGTFVDPRNLTHSEGLRRVANMFLNPGQN